jgi:hypothetical protein
VAYADGSLVILNMRSCRVAFPLGFGDKKAKKVVNPDVIKVLEWTISKFGNGMSLLHNLSVDDEAECAICRSRCYGPTSTRRL